MTSDAIKIVKFLFSDIWSLFTAWKIPGTNVTPAMWAMFCLFFVFVIKFVLPGLFGIGLNSVEGNGKHDN